MSVTVTYVRGAEDPPLQRKWFGPPGPNGEAAEPVDLTAYGTLTLRMQLNTGTPILKSTGITGDANGVLTITWGVGDLDVPKGGYDAQVWATDGSSRDRVMGDITIQIDEAIPTP